MLAVLRRAAALGVILLSCAGGSSSGPERRALAEEGAGDHLAPGDVSWM
eukprot:COSAG04_NODE_22279_length_357_cov_1.387597_1_plen_48_part_10